MTRLIDANICIAKIKDMPVTYDAETVQRCIEVVSNAPTIDAIPIEWIEKKRKEMFLGSDREQNLKWLLDEWREEHAEVD